MPSESGSGLFDPCVIGTAPYTAETLAVGSVDPESLNDAPRSEREVVSLSGFVSPTLTGGVLISASAKNRDDVALGGVSITVSPGEAERLAEELLEAASEAKGDLDDR